MLGTVLTSVVISAMVWGLIWNFSRLVKRTRFSYLVNEKSQENPIGNIYTKPSNDEINEVKKSALSNNLNSIMKPIEPKKDEFSELLEQVEETNDSKIIFINHRSSTPAIMGMPLPFGESHSTLSQKDAIKIIDILRDIPEKKTLDIILNTTGGSVGAAEIIINALHNHHGKIRFYIPHYAQSAGLLLALMGNDIYLGKNGFVSPFDPQLGYGISAASVKRFCDNRRSRNGSESGVNGESGWIGDLMDLTYGEAQAAIDRIYTLVEKILISTLRGDCTERVQEELASGKYNHCKSLFFSDLNSILTNVHPSVPDDIFRLFELHNKNGL
jgi:ATP-dependent protease ClpP protease subunit